MHTKGGAKMLELIGGLLITWVIVRWCGDNPGSGSSAMTFLIKTLSHENYQIWAQIYRIL